MDVVISGSGGLLGGRLLHALTDAGHRIVRLVRPGSSYPGDTIRWDPTGGRIEADGLEGVDAVVHLAGEPLLGRWTQSKQRRIRDSRVQGTRLLAGTLGRLDDPPAVLLSASAVGWYGDRGDQVLTEDSDPGSGFMASLCQDWESATQPATDAGVRVVNLRTGLVQSPENDLLKLQLPPFKLGLGAKIGDGRQWFPWIHIDDHIRAQMALLDDDNASGPFNLSAPNPTRNEHYADVLASVLNRPRFLAVPTFAIAAVFGRTAADQMISVSQRALPQRLSEELDFTFHHPHLEEALEDLLS